MSEPYVTDYPKAGPYLAHDAPLKFREKWGDITNWIATITEEERGLDQGRFAHYAAVVQEWVVSLPTAFSDENLYWTMTGDAIDWIGEHCDGDWAVRARCDDDANEYLDFSFADPIVACAFKLVHR